MAVTGTYTAREIITQALRKLGVSAVDTTPTADELSQGLTALNFMLKAMQNEGFNLFNYATQSVTATTSAAHTMDPVRPIRVHGVRFRKNGLDTPMEALTRQEYLDLPNKSSTGTPTTYYYDKQRESAVLYVWPLLSSASGETFEVDYEAEYEDATSFSAVIPVPGEYWEAVVYGLAARLADDYAVEAPNILMRAEMAMRDALAADREGSVIFGNADGYD